MVSSTVRTARALMFLLSEPFAANSLLFATNQIAGSNQD